MTATTFSSATYRHTARPCRSAARPTHLRPQSPQEQNMRRFSLFASALLAVILLCPAAFAIEPADPAADAVAVTPGVATPGQSIKLKWYFTGDKVIVSGGRFG